MTWQSLNRKIDRLEEMVGAVTGELHFNPPEWKEVWSLASEIGSRFKGAGYPSREAQQAAWDRFQALRQRASVQAEREKDERQWKSEQHRNDILRRVENARPSSLFGFDPPDVEEMKALGRILSEAGKMLSRRKSEMLGKHKQECFLAIQGMRDIHDAWWKDLKAQRSRAQEKRRQRIQANLQKNIERLNKATEALERQHRRASELRHKIATAWNEDFASRASGWLAEAEAKIADIEASIARCQTWIEEDESRLT